MTASGLKSMVVAEHIRWLRDQADEVTTPMHVLKLVYISHGWMLGWFGQPLVQERVAAWQYGPVIPELYYAYKVFGKQHIGFYADSKEASMDSDQLKIIRAVESGYRTFSALELSAKTHETGSPWDTAVKKYGLNCWIPNGLIEKYYAAKVQDFSGG